METEENNIDKNIENEDKSKKKTEEERKPDCCKIFVGWFLQILVFAALAFLIISCIKGYKFWFISIIVFIIVYGMYLYQLFKANAYSFLSNFDNKEEIYNILEKNFTQFPELYIYVKCYHKVGGTRKRKSKTVYKLKKKFPFSYYSWKDISGFFLLKKDEKKKYSFLKLYLRDEINFADSLTESDFTIYKNNLYEEYKDYDTHISVSEEKIIPDFKENHLIILDPDNIPCCVSKGLYIFFSICFLGFFYKAYFQSKCTAQNFTIKKIVSTRYDLNNNQNYNEMEPGYKLNENLVRFDRKNTGNINKEYQLQLNQNELNNANQYNNYIPNYQTINDGEQIGVVQNLQPAPLLNNNPVLITDTINVGKNNN